MARLVLQNYTDILEFDFANCYDDVSFTLISLIAFIYSKYNFLLYRVFIDIDNSWDEVAGGKLPHIADDEFEDQAIVNAKRKEILEHSVFMKKNLEKRQSSC